MKKFLRQYGLLAMTGLMVISGCRKKKEPTVTPQAQAPTITVPAPPQQPAPQPAISQPTPAPANTAPQAGTPVKKSSTKKKRKPRTQVAKKTGGTETQPVPQPAQTATAALPSTATASAATTGAPTATAATPAGTSAPGPKTPDAPDTGAVDISAAVDHSQEARQRELTQQLLTSTDANLRGITRTLTADERAMVDEIRNYMAQSRAAITDGDLTRANNLATKAHLLSDELVKH